MKSKRVVRETLSSIEIEEILIEHFNSFDACVLIEDLENDDQIVYAEIIDYKEVEDYEDY